MTAFLFWNLGKSPIAPIVSNLAWHYEVDVLMLAECEIRPAELLERLNLKAAAYRYVPQIGCSKIEMFTRFSPDFIRPVYETDRMTIRNLTLPGLVDILVAIVHFPSKLQMSERDQLIEATRLSGDIRRAEESVGHKRTILVGDLNMNPFEDGVVITKGLHGVMSRKIAQRGNRIVQQVEYSFFYNPMWRLLGDEMSGPPGTYYYNNSQHKVFFWNMFDQILIRPDVLDLFRDETLEIVQTDGINWLVKEDGLPDKTNASDHLPLFFTLAL